MAASFEIEQTLWEQGYQYIVGLDEVGRGSWAGPVVVAAVIFPQNTTLDVVLDDSKKLTPTKRAKLISPIQETSLAYAYGSADNRYIDTYGIVPATQYAMKSALEKLSVQPDFHLVDAFIIEHINEARQQAIIRGDAISSSIAAASILAKEYRDALMRTYDNDESYAPYQFGQHKGYGTKIHSEAISAFRLSDLHRKSFVPDRLL